MRAGSGTLHLIAQPLNFGRGGGWAYKRWSGSPAGYCGGWREVSDCKETPGAVSGRVVTEPLPRPAWLFQAGPLVQKSLAFTRKPRVRLDTWPGSLGTSTSSDLLLVHVAPKADHFDVDDFDGVIDGIDDPDVADSQPETALQFTAERFDVVVIERVFRQTVKGGIETAGCCGVRFLIKLGCFSGKLYLIHRGESS